MSWMTTILASTIFDIMFAEGSFASPTSSGSGPSYGSLRESMRKTMYKKGTPPWRELHKQRLRERLREGRHRLLGRLRGLDTTSASCLPGASAGISDQDQLLAEWEQLEKEIIAEETDRLIREFGGVEPDLEQDWSLLAEDLLSDTLTCPLCQTAPAQLTGDRRLTCRCGLAVRAPYADLQLTGQALLDGVASHESLCAEPELFFSQSDGELTVVCMGCGMQGPAFQC